MTMVLDKKEKQSMTMFLDRGNTGNEILQILDALLIGMGHSADSETSVTVTDDLDEDATSILDEDATSILDEDDDIEV